MTPEQRAEVVARARALALTEGCAGCQKPIRSGDGSKICFREEGEGTACTVVVCAGCFAKHWKAAP